MSSKHKRPISPFPDVTLGSIGFPLLSIGIFYGLDIWLSSPRLLSYPLNLSGIVFIILGVSLSSWCFRVAFALPKEPILVTRGPWAHTRHPIYLAGLLVNLGVAMMIGTALLVLEFIGYALLEILFDTPREEKTLRKSFPEEYEEYSKRVPSWIPRIKG
ncbi:MAG: methyltransferase family protein [Nitrososphaerales archaeon]